MLLSFFCPLRRKFDAVRLSVYVLELVTRLNRASGKTSQWYNVKRCSSAKNNPKHVYFLFYWQSIIASRARPRVVARSNFQCVMCPSSHARGMYFFFSPELETICSLFKYPLSWILIISLNRMSWCKKWRECTEWNQFVNKVTLLWWLIYIQHVRARYFQIQWFLRWKCDVITIIWQFEFLLIL